MKLKEFIEQNNGKIYLGCRITRYLYNPFTDDVSKTKYYNLITAAEIPTQESHTLKFLSVREKRVVFFKNITDFIPTNNCVIIRISYPYSYCELDSLDPYFYLITDSCIIIKGLEEKYKNYICSYFDSKSFQKYISSTKQGRMNKPISLGIIENCEIPDLNKKIITEIGNERILDLKFAKDIKLFAKNIKEKRDNELSDKYAK